jgi:hypothetical protein
VNKIELIFLGVTVALALTIGLGLLIADTHRIPETQRCDSHRSQR